MTIYNVSNASQLTTAIASAVGGDKIILAAGNYGSPYIQNRNYSANVTIQAATPGTSVHFDGLTVLTSKNLTFSGIDVGRALGPTDAEYTPITSIRDSSNVKLTGMSFHGSLDGDPSNDGIGINLVNAAGFSVSNSSFKELYRGFVVQTSTNITVQNNDFTLLRSDGIISAGNDGIMIDGNHFSNFHPVLGDHGDAIQFFNIGQTKGQSNITVKNNVQIQSYFSGVESTGVQGIWITDGEAYGYHNILIQNNLMYSNDLYNGIGIGQATNVQIIGNTIVSAPNDTEMFWIRLEDDTQVLLKDNVTDNIVVNNTTQLFQSGNTNFTLDPGARAMLANLLNPTDVHDLIMPGAGYQVPNTAEAAPVSSAVGNGISSMLAKVAGATVGQIALTETTVSDHDTVTGSTSLDTSASKAVLVAAQPVFEQPHSTHAFTSEPHMLGWHFDYFTAIA